MNLEVKVSNNTQVNDILNLRPDIIGIGDEGCCHKLPTFREIMDVINVTEEAGIKIRLVTPRIVQNKAEEVLTLINELSKKNIEYYLTLNDLGMLYECNKRKILPNNVTIGRTLSKSLVECEWYGALLEDENESVRRTLYQNLMCQKVKLDYLKSLGLNGIEMCMVDKQKDTIRNLKENGLKVHIHYGLVTIAFSRVCQTAKYFNTEVPSCVGKCGDKIEIEMSQIWNEGYYLEMDEKLMQLNPKFLLYGNILYRNNDMNVSDFDFKNVDSIIFDLKEFDGIDSLSDTVDYVRENIKKQEDL